MKYFINIAIFFIFIITNSVRAEMEYPYIASSERTAFIENQYEKIKPGDTKNTVLNILKEPDEIHELFEPKKYKPKVIGKTYWYIIQRISNTGSVNEKSEILVRISFDLEEKVVDVAHWGF